MQSLDQAIRDLLQHHAIPSRIEVIGVSTDVIENVLPILYPSLHFVSKIQDNEDCSSLAASLYVESSESSQCNVRWSIDSTPRSAKIREIQWDQSLLSPLLQRTRELLAPHSALF